MPRIQTVCNNNNQAAMYVRMSTEHQKYSIDTQSEAIERYAKEHLLVIVKRFVDSGKSGLTLTGRPNLRQLLLEVISGDAFFSHVLVYDVSRWGRFQDADESAYYEYMCRNANVRLHYCAEQFENDCGPYSSLIKAVKRTMAGEYSRELSVKVFKGQSRLAKMGFRQGGSAGYGLRRQTVDSCGKLKATLKSGESKMLQSDRVILVPGPKSELAVIREIFRLYVVERKSQCAIAKILNNRKVEIPSETSLPKPKWSERRVHEILTNPKYVGANVYNRRSCKLDHKAISNPAQEWICKDHAFTPIVTPDWFAQAHKIMRMRSAYLNADEILDRLRWLFKKAGKLTSMLINDDPATPCTQTIEAHFGSLSAAYQLIGYKPRGNYYGVNKRPYQIRKRRNKSLSQELREAISSGKLLKRFTIRAFALACPGWSAKTYTSFVTHSSIPGGNGTFGILTRVGRGTYQLT